jgi:hypothetical protein
MNYTGVSWPREETADMPKPKTPAELVREAEQAVLEEVGQRHRRVDPRDLVRKLPRARGLDERAVSLAVVRLVEDGRLRMTHKRYLSLGTGS